MVRFDDVSLESIMLLWYHWKVFPGPPSDIQVNTMESDWFTRTIVTGVTVTTFGDTVWRE